MDKVDLVVGGKADVYGGMYVWAPEHGLGKMFEDPADEPMVVAQLLDTIEKRTGKPTVTGEIVRSKPPQLDTDMFGQAVVAQAPKKGQRKRKPRPQDNGGILWNDKD